MCVPDFLRQNVESRTFIAAGHPLDLSRVADLPSNHVGKHSYLETRQFSHNDRRHSKKETGIYLKPNTHRRRDSTRDFKVQSSRF